MEHTRLVIHSVEDISVLQDQGYIEWVSKTFPSDATHVLLNERLVDHPLVFEGMQFHQSTLRDLKPLMFPVLSTPQASLSIPGIYIYMYAPFKL
jgi:hypothetical protein